MNSRKPIKEDSVATGYEDEEASVKEGPLAKFFTEVTRNKCCNSVFKNIEADLF